MIGTDFFSGMVLARMHQPPQISETVPAHGCFETLHSQALAILPELTLGSVQEALILASPTLSANSIQMQCRTEEHGHGCLALRDSRHGHSVADIDTITAQSVAVDQCREVRRPAGRWGPSAPPSGSVGFRN